MKKQLLLDLIQHQIDKGSRVNSLTEFKKTIINDELLGDEVEISDFPNHLYTVQQIKWMTHLLTYTPFY